MPYGCVRALSARARNARRKGKEIYFHEKSGKFVRNFVEKTGETRATFARKDLSRGGGCDKVTVRVVLEWNNACAGFSNCTGCFSYFFRHGSYRGQASETGAQGIAAGGLRRWFA